MATRFLGPDFQINIDIGQGEGILGSQMLPEVTTLSDGRFAVVYQSDHGGVSGDPDPIAVIFNADGASTLRYEDIYNIGFAQTAPAVAARPDGGFGVVFTNQLHADAFPDPNGPNITYVPIAPDGQLIGPALAIGDFDIGGRTALLHPSIATLASGRQVVVFERIFVPGDDDVFLNVVSADGKSTERPPGGPFAVANDGNFQGDPSVVAGGEKALVVYEDSRNTTFDSRNIVARIFDGTRNEFADPITIADHASALVNPKIAALDDHRYVIIYTDFDDVFGRIYDTSNGMLSAEFEIDRPALGDFAATVAATADGGFMVAWHGIDGVTNDIFARRYNSDGVAMGQQFAVNRLTDDEQLNPTVTVSGANAFFGWTDNAVRSGDTHPFSVRGQVMSLTTQPDFNDNGVSDILWRNDNGSLAAWDMNRNGAIGGSAELRFGGVAVRPDASWSIAGISDFTGDGMTDVIWRSTSGEIAEWQMNGAAIAGSADLNIGGSAVRPDTSWSIAGVGDFNADARTDILWRNDSGALAEWMMNGNRIVSSTTPTFGGNAAAPDASWHTQAKPTDFA